ncbi:MAG: hypothetical protein WCO56_02625 [Verrucomicrobiota bacterium]
MMILKLDNYQRWDTPYLRYADGAVTDLTNIIMAQIKYNTRGLKPGEQLTKVKGTIDGCTNNPNVPGVTTQVTAVQTAYDLAKDSVDHVMALESQLKEARIERDRLLKEMLLVWKLLGTKVEDVTGGDAAKIASTTFEIVSAPTNKPMPEQIIDVYAEATKKAGEVRVTHKRDTNAASYEFDTSPDPITETSWTHRLTSTKSRNLIKGLSATPKLWVRVRGIKGDYEGAWSDPALTNVL